MSTHDVAASKGVDGCGVEIAVEGARPLAAIVASAEIAGESVELRIGDARVGVSAVGSDSPMSVGVLVVEESASPRIVAVSWGCVGAVGELP